LKTDHRRLIPISGLPRPLSQGRERRGRPLLATRFWFESHFVEHLPVASSTHASRHFALILQVLEDLTRLIAEDMIEQSIRGFAFHVVPRHRYPGSPPLYESRRRD
jgi:hypothetical protein